MSLFCDELLPSGAGFPYAATRFSHPGTSYAPTHGPHSGSGPLATAANAHHQFLPSTTRPPLRSSHLYQQQPPRTEAVPQGYASTHSTDSDESAASHMTVDDLPLPGGPAAPSTRQQHALAEARAAADAAELAARLRTTGAAGAPLRPRAPGPAISPAGAAANTWLMGLCVDAADLQPAVPGALCYEVGRRYNFTPEATALGTYYNTVVRRQWASDLLQMTDATRALVDDAVGHLSVNLAAKVLGDRYFSVHGLMERVYGCTLEPGTALQLELSCLEALEWRLLPHSLMSRHELQELLEEY